MVPAYHNLDDEVFSVRFLCHEAQHFADKRAFPGLDGWELEYRAKLVELALPIDSQRTTLRLFGENRSPSPSAPHGYANAKVLRDVAARLGIDEASLCGNGALPADAIRLSARRLLDEDTTARRTASGNPASPGPAV